MQAVIALSETVGGQMNEENIEEAYFLKKRNTNNKNQSLVVKFNSKSAKNKLMDAKKKLKENENTKSIYVNDFLSKESLELFNYAKSIKTVGYKYIYTYGNKIYVKRSALNKPKLIRSKEDVDEILLEATTNNFHGRRSMRILSVPEEEEDTDDNDVEVNADFVSPVNHRI